MAAPRLFLSVDVEEWFDSTKLVTPDNIPALEAASDVEETTGDVLAAFADAGARGTFFFLKGVAERHPKLIERVLSGGHEVALHGETHAHLSTLTDDAFAESLGRCREFFQTRYGVPLQGYRAPYFSMSAPKLSVLKKAGFGYDSSIVPCLPIPGWYGDWTAPLTPYPAEPGLLELPLTVHPLLRIPGLGGYYLRNLPLSWSRLLLRSSLERLGYAMLYVHPWELSERLPKDAGMPFYMDRRAGRWTRDALRDLLATAKEAAAVETGTLADYAKSRRSAALT